jgi:hypothetical protein
MISPDLIIVGQTKTAGEKMSYPEKGGVKCD